MSSMKNTIVDASVVEVPKIPVSRLSISQLQEIVQPIIKSKNPILQNWGGTFQCLPKLLFEPKTITQCLSIIELARRLGNIECRALGRGHSPGDLPFTKGWQIQMKELKGLVEIQSIDINTAKEESSKLAANISTKSTSFHPSITILAGTYLSEMHTILENATIPLALPNLGSISEQTIGGLISTASHGTGFKFPVLSAYVESLKIICALNEKEGGTQTVECSRSQKPELFNASLCGLGSTGLIVEIRLKVDYWFKLKQISEEIRFDDLIGPQTDTPAISTFWNEEDQKILSNFESKGVKKVAKKAKDFVTGEGHDVQLQADTIAIKRPMSIGKLLAHQPHLVPGCPDERLPTYRTEDPSQIYPIEIDETQDMMEKEKLDEETLKAQNRLESLGKSSQHVRIAWFPQVGMCTLMRMNKTLEPIQSSGIFSKLYSNLVGYHFVQFLLFTSRYRPSILPRVNKLAYWLTHPSQPKTSIIKSKEEEPLVQDISIVEDPSKFANGTFDPSNLAKRVTLSKNHFDPKPFNENNAQSVLIDFAPKVFNFDCLFQQYTNEWAIPLACLASCLRVMRDWLKEEQEIIKEEQIHFPVEIRFVDSDGIWLSPCNGRKMVYIGIVQYRPYNLPIRYRSLFEKFEILMRHFGGRPHWSKAHSCGPLELQRLYPNLQDFLKLIQTQADPDGIFLNPYVRRHLLGDLRHQSNPRIFKARL